MQIRLSGLAENLGYLGAAPAGRGGAVRTAEDEQTLIQSLIASGEYGRMAVANRIRVCKVEPWTCPAGYTPENIDTYTGTPVAQPKPIVAVPGYVGSGGGSVYTLPTANTVNPPRSQDQASATTGRPNQSVPPHSQPGEVPSNPPKDAAPLLPGPGDGDNSTLIMLALAGIAAVFLISKK